jgi:hypothetical protein
MGVTMSGKDLKLESLIEQSLRAWKMSYLQEERGVVRRVAVKSPNLIYVYMENGEVRTISSDQGRALDLYFFLFSESGSAEERAAMKRIVGSRNARCLY